ncbi:MAG: hypothetical protein AAF382_04920 [Pseudomonadota bacterium]
MRRITSFLPSAAVVMAFSAPAAQADAFQHSVTKGGVTLEIEQAYSDAGVSQPSVRLNGAVLRAFSFKQTLTLAFSGTLAGAEEIAVLHHWDGGNGCAGNVTVFSLSEDGFYQSADLGNCTEGYDVSVTQEDGLDLLVIETYQTEAKAQKTGHWQYFDGTLVDRF